MIESSNDVLVQGLFVQSMCLYSPKIHPSHASRREVIRLSFTFIYYLILSKLSYHLIIYNSQTRKTPHKISHPLLVLYKTRTKAFTNNRTKYTHTTQTQSSQTFRSHPNSDVKCVRGGQGSFDLLSFIKFSFPCSNR